MIVWKVIPGYEGIYEASNLGEIRTVKGKVTSSARFKKRVWEQRVLKQKYKSSKNGRKDAMVTLWKDNKPHYHLVSRLIATTFHENLINTKATVNHIDGNPQNNNADNLEWLTLAENIKFGIEHGQYSLMMKSITASNQETSETLFAKSYAEMDRLLHQYKGYTSRMMKMKSDFLLNKLGEKYEVHLF